jgi:mRNA-degrading endonuclease YafQ of YafQ-DinJ toxin-antitoxin module
MYKILETQKYHKKLLNFLKKHKNMTDKHKKVMFLLGNNLYHPSLRLYKLQGELKNYYSISLDLEYRIILDFIIIDNQIYLLDIGSHDEIY